MNTQSFRRTAEIVVLLDENPLQDILLFLRRLLYSRGLLAIILFSTPYICCCNFRPLCEQHKTLHHIL